MQTNIVKWGNSQGIRIPKYLLESAKMENNEAVEIVAESDRLIIKKAEIEAEHQTIEMRFKEYVGSYEATEVDWGEPQGKEIW